MAQFFIDRPVFAWVLAIVVMLFGALALYTLPVSMYPKIAPPSVTVTATYNGATAEGVEYSATQIIEQQMQSLDGLMYMEANSDVSGSIRLRLTFDPSVNHDIAQTQVMNKVQLAMRNLPASVQKNGVRVDKANTDFVCMLAFVSTDGTMNNADIIDYVGTYVSDTLARIPGVGNVRLYGSQRAIRIWLNPERLAAYKLTPSDITAAVSAQNAQVSAGQLGDLPQTEDSAMNIVVTAQERMTLADEFKKIIIRTLPDGSLLRLEDVARVELGQRSYRVESRYNGGAGANLGINLGSDANALETRNRVMKKLEEMQPYFPKGLEYRMVFDTTPFIKTSIKGVVRTLFEAIVLVFLTLLLFLHNFRATIIPTLAVPVVLLGTFGVLAACGFTINTLTLFGMVLAIGLLVDDAIVVVENVERLMTTEGLSPYEATKKSMKQITGAIMGIAVVLAAVFLPMAFFGGSVGVIYRQFSITIVSAMFLSVAVAIVFTPALCATILKKNKGEARGPRRSRFNEFFSRLTTAYSRHVVSWLKHPWLCFMLYGAITAGMIYLFQILPTAFIPREDQGRLVVSYELPRGSTRAQTQEVVKRIEKYFMEEEKDTVARMSMALGFSFAGEGQSIGQGFLALKDWSEREGEGQDAASIARRANAVFSKFKEAKVMVNQPAAIPGLGTSAGFDFRLEDRSGVGYKVLTEACQMLLEKARQSPLLANIRLNATEDAPRLRLEVDREKAGMYSINLADVNELLNIAWGGSYFDDFIHNNRVKRVYAQGDAQYRMRPDDLRLWHVRNKYGEMIPLSAFATLSWTYGPTRLQRYNAFTALNILGQAAPGVASGEAMAEMERLAGELPDGIGFEWSGISYQEKESNAQAGPLYALSILVIFLALAALYESWVVPFSVLLLVPVGVFGALAAAYGRGMQNDIYFQVAILTTIGLASKNAILIVEFAKELHAAGMNLWEATVKACELRFRPIIMTSMAFLLGVVPLAISTGAGSASHNSIGTGIVGGTLVATVLGVLFVPVFFYYIMRFVEKVKGVPDKK